MPVISVIIWKMQNIWHGLILYKYCILIIIQTVNRYFEMVKTKKQLAEQCKAQKLCWGFRVVVINVYWGRDVIMSYAVWTRVKSRHSLWAIFLWQSFLFTFVPNIPHSLSFPKKLIKQQFIFKLSASWETCHHNS